MTVVLHAIGALMLLTGVIGYLIAYGASSRHIIRNAPSRVRGVGSVLNSSRHLQSPYARHLALAVLLAIGGAALLQMG